MGVSFSFLRLLTKTANTKRPPAVASGKRGTPATNLTGVRCTPLYPVDPELRERLALESPHTLWQVFVPDGTDIQAGDILTYGGKDYPVKAVAAWPWPSTDQAFGVVIVEELA